MADIDKGLPNVKRPDEEVAAEVNVRETFINICHIFSPVLVYLVFYL
jgi:hypothetical protein